MRIINEISDFIFVEDALEKADVIFIPGGSYSELPERAASLWREGYAPYVVPSGKFSVACGMFMGVKSKQEIYNDDYATECHFYTDVLLRCGVDEGCIIGEDKAEYTAQNARYSRALLEERGICPKKAILCCKAYHARRCLMYYQLSFPDTQFIVAPVAVGGLTRESWHRTERGLKKVLGELARLGTQFTPEYSPEITDYLKL